jgi:LacI family transcriptional regulator
MSRPTMKHVAARAGVDTSTVSRALNERTRDMLSGDTVERVLAAAADLGYRPNALARSLRTQRSHVVGMVVPDLTNPFFPPILRGLEDVLGRHGYTLLVTNTDNHLDRERQALHSLLERQVDAMVLATSHIGFEAAEPLAVGALPVVLVNRRSIDASVPFVVPDDDAAVHEVAAHLYELGHRRVAHVAGPQDVSTGRARAEVFVAACAELGLPEPDMEVSEAFAVEPGRRATEKLLARGIDASAIFAGNDLLAIGALQALRDGGRQVPDDVSLVGYNDMPLVDMIDPPLTTVEVPKYAMGERAAELLLTWLDTGEPPDHGTEVTLPCHLVVRRSSAALT